MFSVERDEEGAVLQQMILLNKVIGREASPLPILSG